jgi:predicted dehydrogenase
VWRIGILAGTGTALKRTIPALLDSQLCRVTVVHGRDSDRLKKVAELDPEIQLVTSEAEFVRRSSEYDVVFIASPPFLHLRHLELAVGLGLPVICEKPLISRREELPQLLALLADDPVPFTVAHHLRHQPAVTDIESLLREERLGRPVSADLQWCFLMNQAAPSAGWKLDPERGGSSAMYDCGIHAVDLAVKFFGVPERVAAFAHEVRSERTDDTVTALLDYAGMTVRVLASQSAAATGNDLRITFGDAVLRAENLLGEKPIDRVDIVGGTVSQVLHYQPVNPYRLEVEDFCRWLDAGASGGPVIGTDFAAALATTRILFGIEDALQRRESVTL